MNSEVISSIYYFTVITVKEEDYHIFTAGGDSAITDLHPIAVNNSNIVIKGGVDIYITPELYAKKSQFLKKLMKYHL